MKNNLFSSKLNRADAANALFMTQTAAKYLTDLERTLGDKYDSEDRRADKVQAIREALQTIIEAAADLYAYELESISFVEAEAIM